VYDEWLMKVRCAAFGVPPQEIGFTADVNKATGEQQENVVYRRGVKPLSLFFKDLFDDVLALDLQMADYEWVWTGGEPEDKLVQAQTDDIYVRMGKVSVDELRARDGQDLIGLGPFIDTPMGPVFVEELLAGEPDEDPATNEADKPLPRESQADAGAAPASDEPPADGAVSEATMADLRKWRAIAIKCVKAHKPQRDFLTESIPLELHARVERFLKSATDVPRVIAAFDLAVAEHQAVQKVASEQRQLTRGERRTAAAYRRLMAKHFKGQQAALVEHLQKGLA
jgi:hypothetical protein